MDTDPDRAPISAAEEQDAEYRRQWHLPARLQLTVTYYKYHIDSSLPAPELAEAVKAASERVLTRLPTDRGVGVAHIVDVDVVRLDHDSAVVELRGPAGIFLKMILALNEWDAHGSQQMASRVVISQP